MLLSKSILRPFTSDGDGYWYGSGVRLSIAGGYYVDTASCGPLAFDVLEILTFTGIAVGSSGYL